MDTKKVRRTIEGYCGSIMWKYQLTVYERVFDTVVLLFKAMKAVGFARVKSRTTTRLSNIYVALQPPWGRFRIQRIILYRCRYRHDCTIRCNASNCNWARLAKLLIASPRSGT